MKLFKFFFLIFLLTFSLTAGSPNPINNLNTNSLLNSSYFPDTTNLYGWNAFAQGTLANADWIGSEDLVDASGGAIAYDGDHLGIANNAIDVTPASSNSVYINSATFDTGNESFTTGGWFKFDRTGVNEYLISKFTTTNAEKSFYIGHEATGTNFRFRVYYDNANGNEDITISDDYVADGNWHHIVGVYNQSVGSITLYIDGKIYGYFKNSNLTSRNNDAGAALTLGGYDGDGTPTGFFDGQIADVFYKKTTLTHNEILKIYCAGKNVQCNVDINGNITVMDGRSDYGEVVMIDTSDRASSAPGTGNWRNVGSTSITLPAGTWDVEYRVNVVLNDNGANLDYIDLETTLSTANNSESDSRFSVFSRANPENASAVDGAGFSHKSSTVRITLTATDTYYLNAKYAGETYSGSETLDYFGSNGDIMIRAIKIK